MPFNLSLGDENQSDKYKDFRRETGDDNEVGE